MIVTVLAEKGGTGKTMLATNLAGMRAAIGRRVLLIDADRQGSAERWANVRADSGLPEVECAPLYGAALARFLRTRASVYDDVVIDVGAGDTDEMSAALRASDCAIVPVRPTAVDVWTMTLMDSRIDEARLDNQGLRAWALINQASTNPRNPAAGETRRVLSEGCAALSVAGPVLRDRVAFQRAYSSGRTVDEYRSRAEKAAEEIAALCRVIFDEVHGAAVNEWDSRAETT